MKCSKPISVKDIAQRFNLTIVGDSEQLVFGINEIHKVGKGDLTFVDHEKYYSKAIHSQATIIVIDKEAECPEGKTLLIGAQPFEIYNALVLEQRPIIPQLNKICDTAWIHPSAIVEAGVVIGHYCLIGEGSVVGANTIIGEYSVIGSNVHIQPGCIIGTDAFYYKKTKEGFKKWRSCGRVVIHDDVEIGAGCTINKGVSGDTIIGQGTKMDCQVHIGHGVVLGKHCLIAGQVGIGGKSILGNNVVLYGQVGITQNLIIGDNVTVLAGSGVAQNLEEGKAYFGSPAEEARSKMREIVALRHLPEWMKTNKK